MATLTVKSAKLCNYKAYDTWCRFGVGIYGKDKEGKFVNDMYINATCSEILDPSKEYDLTGYLLADRYNGKSFLAFKVKEAVLSQKVA